MLGSPTASTSSAAAAASFRSSLLHFSTIHRARTCPSTSQPVPVGCVRLQSCSSSRAAPPIKAMAAEAEILSAPDKELRPSSPRGKHVLISLSDKTDLAFLGKGLQELGYTVVSTGGTTSALENAGSSVTKVEQLTCFPEMNHQDVLVVIDSHDYPALLEFLKSNGDDQQFCRKLSWKAFQCVASYDSAVSEWFWSQTTGEDCMWTRVLLSLMEVVSQLLSNVMERKCHITIWMRMLP